MAEASNPLPRRLLAEGLGTAILVATVVGSGIMAERLAGGNQAIALLGNTIPTGAILAVIITIFAPVSGAHFNPAVSLVVALRGEMRRGELIPYIAVQCAGGVAGTVIAHLMFDLAPLMIGTTARSGPSQWFAEAVATFTLILTILGGLRYAPQSIPWLVGLVITAAYWFTSSTSFEALIGDLCVFCQPAIREIAGGGGEEPHFAGQQAADAGATSGAQHDLVRAIRASRSPLPSP